MPSIFSDLPPWINKLWHANFWGVKLSCAIIVSWVLCVILKSFEFCIIFCDTSRRIRTWGIMVVRTEENSKTLPSGESIDLPKNFYLPPVLGEVCRNCGLGSATFTYRYFQLAVRWIPNRSRIACLANWVINLSCITSAYQFCLHACKNYMCFRKGRSIALVHWCEKPVAAW